MITNTQITIYNKIAGTETYQRTVIPGQVQWDGRKGANGLRTGALAANTARVIIPMSLAKDYLRPKAWQALTPKTGKWTIQEKDIIVIGAVTDEIHALIPAVVGPPAVAEVPAFTVSSLKNKYDYVLEVTSVDPYYGGALSHFEVGAK